MDNTVGSSDFCVTKVTAEDALFVEKVLVSIFEYMNVQDLVRCRGVCRTWKAVATPFLQDKIGQVDILFHNNRQPNTDNAFVDMTQESHLKFTNFNFHNFSIERSDSFRQYRPMIQSLKLFVAEPQNSDFDNPNQKNSKDIPFRDLLKALSNLETLEILSLPESVRLSHIVKTFPCKFSFRKLRKIKIHQEFRRRTGFHVDFLRDLFHLCPNLEDFRTEIECDYATQVQEHAILECLADSPTYASLTVLQLAMVNADMMTILANELQEMQLRKFSVKLFDRLESTDFQAFLDWHKDSLESFAFGLSRCSGLRVHFPVMRKLKELSIVFLHDFETNTPSLGRLNYAHLFPNLVTLRIEDPTGGTNPGLLCDWMPTRQSYSVSEIFPVQTAPPAPSLKNLQLPQNLASAKLLAGIADLFPNLKRLNVGPQEDSRVLEKIWRSVWAESLEVLQVSFFVGRKQYRTSSKLDSIFTGIPETECQNVASAPQKSSEEPEPSFCTDYKAPSPPSLANLKKLRYLIISATPLSAYGSQINSKLTDLAGDAVLSQMRELKGLRIENGLTEISDECQERMCAKLGLINVFPPTRRLRPHGVLHLVKYEWQDKGLLSNYSFDATDFDGF